MKNNLNKARQNKSKPNWIADSTWDILCQQWASQAFKKKSIIGKGNRASDCGGFGGSLHTCDFISTSQHRYNMVIYFANYFSFYIMASVHNFVKIYFIFLDKDEWNSSQ